MVVIGAGQAGLATSYHLTEAGIDHLVIEAEGIGHSWRTRWDSFCLVLPNWTLLLPGHEYSGDHPDGFMPRDEVVAYLEEYAAAFGSPVRTGARVESLSPAGRKWRLGGHDLEVEARAVVVATGSFTRQVPPAGADSLPSGLAQARSSEYTRPDALPPGKVLVVGSGQSGCQIAQDLLLAGREVFLACGRAPWTPRRVAGRDVIWWLIQSGFMDMPPTALAGPEERLGANPQLTGRDGGRDLHYRTLTDDGAVLVGHFAGSDGRRAFFAPDLAESVAFGDEVHGRLSELIRETAREAAIDVGDEPAPPPAWTDGGAGEVDLDGFGAVIWATGFRPGYTTWIEEPVFDAWGFPVQDPNGRGPVPGLHFIGTHFLRKRKSALFMGVGEDAAILVDTISGGGSRSPATGGGVG